MGLPNYDEWKLSPPDEAEVVASCDHCGKDIYEGDDVTFDHEHHIIYCSDECFKEYLIENIDEFIDVIKEEFEFETKQMS